MIAKNEFFIVVRDNHDNNGVAVVGKMIRMGYNHYCHIVPDDELKMGLATTVMQKCSATDINRHAYGLQYECKVNEFM